MRRRLRALLLVLAFAPLLLAGTHASAARVWCLRGGRPCCASRDHAPAATPSRHPTLRSACCVAFAKALATPVASDQDAVRSRRRSIAIVALASPSFRPLDPPWRALRPHLAPAPEGSPLFLRLLVLRR